MLLALPLFLIGDTPKHPHNMPSLTATAIRASSINFDANNDVNIVKLDDNTVRLSWTKGDENRTYIVMKEGSAPTSSSDGIKVFNGVETTCDVHHLSANSTYYFKLYDNDASYNLGSETQISLSNTGFGMEMSEQYVYCSNLSNVNIDVRDRSDNSIVGTITPSTSAGATQAIGAFGDYVAHTGTGFAHVHRVINGSTIQEILNDEAYPISQGRNYARAAYVDKERQYAYFGYEDGTLEWYHLSTLTKYSQSVATDDIRKIWTDNDYLYLVANDDKAYFIDRSDRTSHETPVLINEYTGFNMEVVSGYGDSIYIAGDNTNVEQRAKTSPFTVQDTITNPTNDITSVRPDGEYLSVSSDSGELYVFDMTNSNSLLSTISKSHGIEDSVLGGGDLFYQGGKEGVLDKKFYSRSYLSDSIGTLIHELSITL